MQSFICNACMLLTIEGRIIKLEAYGVETFSNTVLLNFRMGQYLQKRYCVRKERNIFARKKDLCWLDLIHFNFTVSKIVQT